MDRIEDIPNKSELVQRYYSWLLDTDNITLEKELDLSLAQTYDDPYIYYPECMHDLFHTEKLQRLSRVSHLASMFSAYNPSSPIFIEDAYGNAFALEEHPDRTRDWLNTDTYSQVAICILPLLRLQGLSPFKIANYSMECRRMRADTFIDSSLLPSINMKHLQTGHDITSYFGLGQEDSWDDR